MTKETSVDQMIATVLAKFDRIDYALNCAGVGATIFLSCVLIDCFWFFDPWICGSEVDVRSISCTDWSEKSCRNWGEFDFRVQKVS